MPNLEWIPISDIHNANKPLGAIGFIDNKVVIVASFFDYKDANEDGELSAAEWSIGTIASAILNKKATAKVALLASGNGLILEKDRSFYNDGKRIFAEFALSQVISTLLLGYTIRGESTIGLGSNVLSSTIKEVQVRKGFEEIVTKALKNR